MPQKTNLNVAPYYEDFTQDKNFYKVLFRPGYSIQARELTQLQSILQNQIESFGIWMFDHKKDFYHFFLHRALEIQFSARLWIPRKSSVSNGTILKKILLSPLEI